MLFAETVILESDKRIGKTRSINYVCVLLLKAVVVVFELSTMEDIFNAFEKKYGKHEELVSFG